MSFLIDAILLLTSPAAPAQQLLASNVARVYEEDAADRPLALAGSSQPPSNIAIDPRYRHEVAAMLRSSPTFRAQCARIAGAANLAVVVEPSLAAPSESAITHLTRQADGRLHAEVEIGPLSDTIRLIAHEFEHIIEQLDGVDLTALAARRDTGVHTDPRSGHFETERAIAIGRRVTREVSVAAARR